MNTFKEASKDCPFCAEKIRDTAKKCKHCNEYLDPLLWRNSNQKVKQWNPVIALLLGLFIPGAGHMYKGEEDLGVLFLFLVIVGYILCIIPGIILHIVSIVLLFSGDPYKKNY